MLDDHVHAAAAGQFLHALRHIAGRVVDDLVRADDERFLGLVLRSNRRDDFRANILGNLNGHAADAAARPHDQRGFSGSQTGQRHCHVPGRDRDERKSRRLLEGQRGWNDNHVSSGHRDELGIAAVGLGPEHAERGAQVIAPGLALVAGSATQPRRDEDFLADLDAFDLAADPFDLPGDVATGNMRQGNLVARYPLPNPDIQMVQRAGLDADEHFVRLDLRLGPVLVLQLLRPAVFVEDNGFHTRFQLKAIGYWL